MSAPMVATFRELPAFAAMAGFLAVSTWWLSVLT